MDIRYRQCAPSSLSLSSFKTVIQLCSAAAQSQSEEGEERGERQEEGEERGRRGERREERGERRAARG